MTPLEMVKEYAKTSKQKPNPIMSQTLVEEEMDEWYAEWLKNKNKNEPTDHVSELKELSDLVYVIYGYANSMGWDLDEAVKRVHENNMDRMYQDDGTIQWRDDGKVLKNKNYPKVDLTDLVSPFLKAVKKAEVYNRKTMEDLA